MLNKAAEESFRKGLQALNEQGKIHEAMAFFEAALLLETRAREGGTPQARYRSYYGMCLALHQGSFRKGLRLCRKAAEEEFFSPEILVNLGRAEMEAGHRERAHDALVRAVRLEPGNMRTRHYLEILGMRRDPPLSFLRRGHPLNVFLGRMRHKYWRRNVDDD